MAKARLTPLAKGIIAVVILSIILCAGWFLGLGALISSMTTAMAR